MSKKRKKSTQEPVLLPQEVGDVTLAFPARVVGKLLPALEEIPERFHDSRTPWNRLFSEWFFNGLDSTKFHCKDGVDESKALRHIRACMSSYEPSHQHKEAGVAYLMSCFFDKVVSGDTVYQDPSGAEVTA